MFLLQTVTVISLTVILLGSVEGKGVQMQRDVQCCMQYSQGKVRTKDVLRLYTKKVVKCADPRDRKVKRLLRKLLQRQRTKAHRIMWLHPHGNLPVMSEDKKDGWDAFHVECQVNFQRLVILTQPSLLTLQSSRVTVYLPGSVVAELSLPYSP
ncbi:unnamed protein product [Coregonus sp. 'balchen']|nr:unnamed protein product [Coregonus sp. 'balchen']